MAFPIVDHELMDVQSDAKTDREVLRLVEAVLNAVRKNHTWPRLRSLKIDDLESASLTLADIAATGTGGAVDRSPILMLFPARSLLLDDDEPRREDRPVRTGPVRQARAAVRPR